MCYTEKMKFGSLFLAGFVFSTSLGVGMNKIEVKELQKILNSDPQTQISLIGPGSPGQETTYFGPLTRSAVIKFQIKNSIPGTGFVGPLTTKKLNELQNTAQNIGIIDIYATDKKMIAIQRGLYTKLAEGIAAKKPPDLSEFTKSNQVSKVIIQKISKNTAKVGETISIQGAGFQNLNTLYLGPSTPITDVKNFAGTISFTIPAISPGKYDVVVRNSDGISNSTYLVILPDNPTDVRIESIQPLKVRYGESVTIKGSGFSSNNNELHTTLGIIKGIPSADGTTLTVPIQIENYGEVAKHGTGVNDFPIQFLIVNNSGVSSESQFILSL